jgi:hypothetical protein
MGAAVVYTMREVLFSVSSWVVRAKVYEKADLTGAPESFQSVPAIHHRLKGNTYTCSIASGLYRVQDMCEVCPVKIGKYLK